MVWYSHLLMNFPLLVVIYTVKIFHIINKAKVDVFLEFSCFFYDPTDVGNFISHSSAFSTYSWNSGSSQLMYCLNLLFSFILFIYFHLFLLVGG